MLTKLTTRTKGWFQITVLALGIGGMVGALRYTRGTGRASGGEMTAGCGSNGAVEPTQTQGEALSQSGSLANHRAGRGGRALMSVWHKRTVAGRARNQDTQDSGRGGRVGGRN